jgi:exodeoxyribonuclease VIII
MMIVNTLGLAPGILHPDVPFADYLRADGINATGLKKILRSPAHYRASLTEPDEPTESLEFGTLLHTIVLEPDAFEARAVVQRKYGRSKAEKEALAEWEASLAPDAIVVSEVWADKLRTMRDRVYENPHARRLLERGVREGTFWWEDPETGLLCKGRPDFVSATGILVDLKTAADACREAFQRALWSYRYDVQAAHYCAGAEATKIARADAYAFMVIEKEPPYAMAIYTCDKAEPGQVDWSVLGLGGAWRREAMRIYQQCTESGTWPGYQLKPEPITMPRWAQGVGE